MKIQWSEHISSLVTYFSLSILGSGEKGETASLTNCACEVNSIENFPSEDSGKMAITESSSVLDFKKYSIETVDIVFAVLYAIVVFIGLIGNCLVIIVVYRTRSMHSTTNFLLVNLAVSDVIILLWCPRTYSFVFYPNHPTGKLGDYICKIFTGNAIISVAIASSVLTLTILATERYHALMKPMQSELRLTLERVKYVIAIVWIVAILTSLPDFSQNKYSEQYGRCVCPFSLQIAYSLKEHVICTVILLGCLPFLILAYCYFQIIRGLFLKNTVCSRAPSGSGDHQTKRRLAKLLISVTAAFYVCYLPYGVFILYIALQHRPKLVAHEETLSVLLHLFEFLVTSSSCLNPILYAFRSSNYWEGFKKIFAKRNAVQSTRKLSSLYRGSPELMFSTAF